MKILNNIGEKKWVMVLGAALLLIFLNMNSTIHNAIINLDVQVALRMNSLIGHNAALDKMLAWFSTRTGDAFMLVSICSLFFLHSMRGEHLTEFVKRLSFWLWLGVLCLGAYLISCVLAEPIIKRDTPLLALHHIKNLQTMYGTLLHSCPTSSFPSGHGLAYIFFAMMAWKRYSRISLILWTLAIIMLSVRLIVGLHWLSDIVCGSLLISIFLGCLMSETPLKKTYHLIEQGVWLVVKSTLGSYCHGSINLARHLIDNGAGIRSNKLS